MRATSAHPNNTRKHDIDDADIFYGVPAAARSLKETDERLRSAVAAAREAGDSWPAIGVVLGTSKQNAHRKYGH